MKHFKNNRRRFRNNSFDKSFKLNNSDQNLNTNIGNISELKKRNYSRNSLNFSKLIHKYSDLAREALSIGDKILYENYMQHAEHFVRISENNSNNSNSKIVSSETMSEASVTKFSEKKTTKNIEAQAEEN